MLAVLKRDINQNKESEVVYKEKMSVFAVLGGYYEPLRPGGKVQISDAVALDQWSFSDVAVELYKIMI